MAKNCLNKLTSNILTDCSLRPHGVKELYIMYAQDVTLTTSADGTLVSGIAFKEGAKSYKVEGYKQNIQVTSALRTTDASTRLDVSIMFKSILSGTMFRGLSMSKLYVMTVYHDSTGTNGLWGVNAPLECSNVEYDSNANGRLITYTLTAPEGSAGNNLVAATSGVSATIIAKSV